MDMVNVVRQTLDRPIKRNGMKDVAETAGVSIKTVSRVINNLPYVREEVRKKVFEAVEKLNYAPSLEGKRLVSLKNNSEVRTNNIGCVFNLTFNKYSEPFFSELLEEVDAFLMKSNLHNYFNHTLAELENEPLFYRVMNPDVVDGVIFFGVGEQFRDRIEKIRKRVGHAVIIAENLNNGNISTVYPDLADAGYQATKYLISLGHTRIGCVTGRLDWPGYSQLRLEGYQKALKEHGITFDASLTVEGKYDTKKAAEATRILLKKKPTAIFVISDPMAIGAYSAIHVSGLKIPNDISVVSCDGIKFSEHLCPPLTTIDINKKEMARTAVQLLLEEIEQKRKGPVRVIFPVRLVERLSCRRLAG